MEIQVYSAAYRDKQLPATQVETAEKFIRVWNKRGLSQDLPEYKYVMKLMGYAKTLIEGGHVDLSGNAPRPLTDEMREGFDRILYDRRSVREWPDERVPDEVIDKLLDAGLWAAHACNLQSIRYLVIREEDEPGLFLGSDIPGGPVHIVLVQDMRVYEANLRMPMYNRTLDCGAAGQNIVLAAHRYGLGGVWLTFNETMRERLKKRFELPDYMQIMTYVDVGYPDQMPTAPLRNSVEYATLYRI